MKTTTIDTFVSLMGGAFWPGITGKGTIAAVNTFLQDTKTRAAGTNTGAAADTTRTQLAPLTSFSTCNTANNCVAWRSSDGGDSWRFVGSNTCGVH